MGWKLQAGSITPIWTSPTQFSHYIYTDATRAEYSLSVSNNNVWTSLEGVYVSYDANANRLYPPTAASGSRRNEKDPVRLAEGYIRVGVRLGVAGRYAGADIGHITMADDALMILLDPSYNEAFYLASNALTEAIERARRLGETAE
jgi:hypothetical protein